MAFPPDRVYHRGHIWVYHGPDGTVTVGLDDLGSRLLGEPDRVDLPQPGDRVSANGTAWHAGKRNADVRVLSPGGWRNRRDRRSRRPVVSESATRP
jgi:glycine cleavage system H lipoate-binding protein